MASTRMRACSVAVAGVDPSAWGSVPCRPQRRRSNEPGSTFEDLDLIELNEAFAAQSLAVTASGAWTPTTRSNVNGGAIALGHPLGCSGARLLTTLLHEMQRRATPRSASPPCASAWARASRWSGKPSSRGSQPRRSCGRTFSPNAAMNSDWLRPTLWMWTSSKPMSTKLSGRARHRLVEVCRDEHTVREVLRSNEHRHVREVLGMPDVLLGGRACHCWAIRQNLDEFVRRVRRDVAEGLVLEGQHVALGIERVVGGANRRLPVDVLRRSRDPRLRGRWTEAPDVDVGLPLLEGRRGQQRGDQPAGVALELGPFERGVAVAENQEVQLRRGIAALMQRDQSARIRGRYRRDELVSGIDGQRPRVAEDIAGIALLDDDADRRDREQGTAAIRKTSGRSSRPHPSSPTRRRSS